MESKEDGGWEGKGVERERVGGRVGREKGKRFERRSSCFLLSPAGLEGPWEHKELNELQNQPTK